MHNRFFKGLALALTVATVMTSAMPVMADEIVEEVAEEVVVEEDVEVVETLSEGAIEKYISQSQNATVSSEYAEYVGKDKAIKNKTKTEKKIISVKQNPEDTIDVDEWVVKGKVKERHISANSVSGDNAAKVTLNGGIKVVVDNIVKDAKVTDDKGNATKLAKINKKGVLNIKASKTESNYELIVTGKDKDENKVSVIVAVNNLCLSNAKKVVLYSVSKNAKGDFVSVNAANQKVTISLNQVKATEGEANMVSAMWNVTNKKKDVAYATVEPANNHNTAIVIAPVADQKGNVKVTCTVNGKAYKAVVKIANKLPKKWGKVVNPEGEVKPV